ncbi:mitogen-activated protein kinase HOG1, partial [Rozella allomycis CSF55]
RGIKFVHSAGVIHRDLKPSNILINDNCDLKICDFGLARLSDAQMTGYIATRYYRAPEIMLTWQTYDEKIDIWSIGCILAEMLQGSPLFPGKDHVSQFQLIIELLGSPPTDVINRICSEHTLKFVMSLPKCEKKSFREYFPSVIDQDGLDLLEKMLEFDPQKRILASEALKHPYLKEFHDDQDEPVSDKKIDWTLYEKDLDVSEWKST